MTSSRKVAESDRAQMADDCTLALAGDVEIVKHLRELGADSAEYARYGASLKEYGVGTLINYDKQGRLFGELRTKGISLPPPPESWHRFARRVIIHSVSRTVPVFMKKALIKGGWKSHKGASIKTFFIGKCLYSFAEDYKAYFAENDSSREMPTDLSEDFGAEIRYMYIHTRSEWDPEAAALDRDELRRLLSKAKHKMIPAIAFLTAEGYKQPEIAEILGMTPESVSAALRRFRASVRCENNRGPQSGTACIRDLAAGESKEKW